MADYFKNSYRYLWENTESIEKIILNQNVATSNRVNFTIPTLQCQASDSSGFFTIAEMNTRTRVYRQDVVNGVIQPTKTLILERISGGTNFNARNDDFAYITGGSNGTLQLRNISEFSYDDEGKPKYKSFSARFSTFSQIAHASPDFNNKEVEFYTTPLSEDDIADGKSFFYSIECVCLPDNNSGLLSSFTATHRGYHVQSAVIGIINVSYYKATLTSGGTTADPNSIKITTSFYCLDMSSTAEGGPFLMKGVKYNTHQLFRKAMLTVDSQIIDNSITGLDEEFLPNGELSPNNIQYPIIIDPEWNNRMKSTQLYETVLEVKNLWEIFQQIGKYLHAEPVLKFATDGTDRFMLSFKQLGRNDVKFDNSRKITIYNSQALSQFFSTYDSYVTNLFSPQNLCKQSIVVNCSDGSYLVSNDNAELSVAYSTNEIVEFNICYQGVWKDAMKAQVVNDNGDIVKLSSKIYEKSIFDILTSEHKVSPSKADSLYFTMGDTKIQNLTYVPPTDSAYEEQPMALKKIVRQLFGISTNDLNFNELMFEIVYRTQDTVRLTQTRPDMENFVRNSSFEKYPHHEQWFGQQDKIIDSERFSANLFGKLVRVGNSVYQCQEYAEIGNEKESGDLVLIDNEPYYVTEVENEFYPDAILQKVTYSKNFNQLSNIVTIPSEPRFYEISERSKIRREIRMMEFFELTTKKPESTHVPRFLNKDTWKEFIKTIIFNTNTVKIPNFAYTKFRTDYKRVHTGSYGQYVENSKMFPSGEVDRTDPNNITPVESKDYADCIVPLLHFPLHDGIVFEWNMEDNFKAGDYVDESLGGGSTNDDAYLTLQPLRYVDIMGRADLFTFRLFNKSDWSFQETQKLPKASIIPLEKDCQVYLPDPFLIGLDKDCREELSFNYQINFLHRAQKDDDDFITFPNLFGTKDSELKMCLLDEPQSMFNENINLSAANIVADNVEYKLNCNDGEFIEIKITQPDVNLDRVKSIVLYQQDEIGSRAAYIVKNVHNLDNDEKLGSWWIYPVYNT